MNATQGNGWNGTTVEVGAIVKIHGTWHGGRGVRGLVVGFKGGRAIVQIVSATPSANWSVGQRTSVLPCWLEWVGLN